MALEPVTHITDLVSSNPVATDNVSQGDDHLRNIKKALTTDFAGISGPVTATHTELNIVSGKTLSSSDDVIDNFPAGTKMLFQQTSAPTGWTKDTTAAINNGSLRTVTGSVSTGGATSFTTVFGSGKTTGSTTLSAAQAGVGSHKHIQGAAIREFGGSFDYSATTGGARTEGTSAAVAITTHPFTETVSAAASSGHTHTMAIDLKYYDVIIATKN